jgi:phytoene/squalene synthetase
MTIEASLTACEDMVRRADPDRYLSALFAPEERRPLLFALYAFNHELARIGDTVREPMMGEIRLEWWREAIAEAQDGRPRAHDVVRSLAELFARVGPPLDLFEAMIDARQFDLGGEFFADLNALVAYTEATSGSLMRLASEILLDGEKIGDIAHEAGVAYGLTGILRAIRFKASQQKLYLPADLLKAEGIAPEEIFAGKADTVKLQHATSAVAAHARAHYEAAAMRPIPGHSLPALMPAGLVPIYLRRMSRAGFDPLRGSSDIANYRKQISFLRVALTGKF